MSKIRGLISYLSKYRLTSFISILGLSIGLTLTIYLTLFIKYELSYDRLHPKHERIYRLLGKLKVPGQEPEVLAICQGRFPERANNIPEVEAYLRVLRQRDTEMEFDNVRISHNNLLYADSTFFNLFSFKVLSGNPVETIHNPYGLIICKSLALKAFNTIDIIGKSDARKHVTGTSQTYMNFGGFILLIVGYSFILSWIRKISGNKPFSGLYAHGLANAFIPLIPPLILQNNVPQPHFWIWVTMTFLIGIIITVIRDKKL